MENMTNHQGKTPQQYEDAALGAFIGWIGILLFCLIAVLFTGCATTNEAPQKPCCKTEKKC